MLPFRLLKGAVPRQSDTVNTDWTMSECVVTRPQLETPSWEFAAGIKEEQQKFPAGIKEEQHSVEI